MELVYIVFIWIIAMIIYYTWKWRKEKKRIKGVKSYFKYPMTMSIGEGIRRKKNYRKW